MGQIKRANETSVEQEMKEIKKLKYQESHEFKRLDNEDQYECNLKLAEPIDSAKSTAESYNLKRLRLTLRKVRNCSLNGKSIFFLPTSQSMIGAMSTSTSSTI